MNIQDLSKKLLTEALEHGTITLEDGSLRELKTSEILSIAKYIMSNGIVNEEAIEEEATNLPREML